MDLLVLTAGFAAHELALLAGVIFLIFGLDDLLVDILWISGVGRGDVAVDSLAVTPPVRFAIAIPAWDEAAVVGAMLSIARERWAGADCRFYVGVYPNDLPTLRAVASHVHHDPRVRIVINDRPGPTTKGDCLNAIWHSLQQDMADGSFNAHALLLHDAEDMVDRDELRVLADALATADYAQLPVLPLVVADGPWISGHYCDEFAESHGKDMPIRSALRAPLPTAGVGCAFRIDRLARIAGVAGPFHADSLTEDYELGVRLSASGARGRFVRARRTDGSLVAVRAYFPHRIDQSVRQKTRWLRGIAIEAWERLGWSKRPDGGPTDTLIGWWMLWRDRRALMSALAVLAAYAAILSGLTGWAGTGHLPGGDTAMAGLLQANLLLLAWRLAMRAIQTGTHYGWREAARALLRQPVSNIILVMTAWRALRDHILGLLGRPLVWDKTVHRFPLL